MDANDIDVKVGWVSAVVTFVVAWVYCMGTYGFLFGFGLGWLPAAILAAIVGLCMFFAWRIVGALVGLAICYFVLMTMRH